ncbi:hypothetical protein LTR53_020508, partial [Teratosphaeriaceae sp. CCFEE 6253]
MVNSRAFSTAIAQSQRPTAETASAPAPVRHFNTSRSLKSVGDTSTIDFAFFPSIDADVDTTDHIRMPIIAANFSPPKAVEIEA